MRRSGSARSPRWRAPACLRRCGRTARCAWPARVVWARRSPRRAPSRRRDGLAGGADGRGRRALGRARLVVLPPGTPGTPRGAPREPSLRALGPVTSLISQVPLRAREPILVGPPFFHGFGLAYLGLGL